MLWLFQDSPYTAKYAMSELPQPIYLTPEESARVDAALLTSHEKFRARLSISALRLLQQIAAETGVSTDDLTPTQIIAWMEVNRE
jgi:hypothetical protein